uniref:Uncharacterized protein n=1 Tax=Plectus sambesii TaxID=2011161 RepID=A0A914UWK5_9BILA
MGLLCARSTRTAFAQWPVLKCVPSLSWEMRSPVGYTANQRDESVASARKGAEGDQPISSHVSPKNDDSSRKGASLGDNRTDTGVKKDDVIKNRQQEARTCAVPCQCVCGSDRKRRGMGALRNGGLGGIHNRPTREWPARFVPSHHLRRSAKSLSRAKPAILYVSPSRTCVAMTFREVLQLKYHYVLGADPTR